jgi:hypothetical protein
VVSFASCSRGDLAVDLWWDVGEWVLAVSDATQLWAEAECCRPYLAITWDFISGIILPLAGPESTWVCVIFASSGGGGGANCGGGGGVNPGILDPAAAAAAAAINDRLKSGALAECCSGLIIIVAAAESGGGGGGPTFGGGGIETGLPLDPPPSGLAEAIFGGGGGGNWISRCSDRRFSHSFCGVVAVSPALFVFLVTASVDPVRLAGRIEPPDSAAVVVVVGGGGLCSGLCRFSPFISFSLY